jgi:hypothetical protein
MPQITVIPHAKISTGKVILYNELNGRSFANCGKSNSLNNLSDNHVKGVLSKGSKKNIKRNIQIWTDALEAKKFMSRKTNDWLRTQITFCTLTLPAKQFHTDKEIKRELLNRWNIEIKREIKSDTYLWVAEKQDNGNIHFHILYPKFIHWQTVRNKWNKILDDNGYIKLYRENQKAFHSNGFKLREELTEKWSAENQYKSYLNGIACNWSNPNSTDIHSLEKIKNVGNYITKYLTKGNEELKIDGRLWSCSENFRLLRAADFFVDNEIENYIESELKNDKVSKFDAENYSVISGTSLRELRNKSPIIYKKYMEIQNNNYSILYK